MNENLYLIDDFSKWIVESNRIKIFDNFWISELSFDFLIKWYDLWIPLDTCLKIENIENELTNFCQYNFYIWKNKVIHDMQELWIDLFSLVQSKWVDASDYIRDVDFEEIYKSVLDYRFSMQIENKPTPTHWYIYLIKSWEHYKIGKAKSIRDRFKKYITENPNEVELIHSYRVDDYTKEEKRLHDLFKEKNHNREWFNLTEDDINYIKTL